MTRLLLTLGLCLIAHGSLAGEGDRPVARPTYCQIAGSPQVVRCSVLWDATWRTQAPVLRPARSLRPATVPARRITRLPWTIGAFQ